MFFLKPTSHFDLVNFIASRLLNVKNKKIKNISNIHEFFYKQSNYKVGVSENNLQF